MPSNLFQTVFRATLFLGFALSAVSCRSAYYSVWEKLGKEKRDLLHDQVVKAKDDQTELKEEFKDTLSRIRSQYDLKSGGLEKGYDKLSADYEEIKGQSAAIKARADKIDQLAKDLFAEWKAEANTITNETYRKDSLTKLQDSRKQFNKMRGALNGTLKQLETVNTRMRDQVLYLKHNLNAKAINAFKSEAKAIELDVEKLFQAVEVSIRESESFTTTLN